MVDLNGHEAGNGGHSQGRPSAHRDLLYSERRDVTKVSNDSRADWQFCQLAGADDVPTLGSTHERVLKDTSRGFYSL
jgi:hypothetical protein